MSTIILNAFRFYIFSVSQADRVTGLGGGGQGSAQRSPHRQFAKAAPCRRSLREFSGELMAFCDIPYKLLSASIGAAACLSSLMAWTDRKTCAGSGGLAAGARARKSKAKRRMTGENLARATCATTPSSLLFFLQSRTRFSSVRLCFLTRSSRGLGHRPFTAVTRVQIPYESFTQARRRLLPGLRHVVVNALIIPGSLSAGFSHITFDSPRRAKRK